MIKLIFYPKKLQTNIPLVLTRSQIFLVLRLVYSINDILVLIDIILTTLIFENKIIKYKLLYFKIIFNYN